MFLDFGCSCKNKYILVFSDLIRAKKVKASKIQVKGVSYD
jgi:hypothetical protein